uniref:Trichoplein keratin filament-binding protein n=1 Tax=Aquila chrysaetos chrysaetos TaxID=223781 RepID=A0A663EVP1_AQUCH
MWEKREEEWEREKVARDRLMNEVLAGRQRQIQEKMELNRRAQEESIKYREQLIKELEEAKELTRQEKEQEEELKAQVQHLTACCLQEREEQQCQREEEEEERSAQQRCEELVRQEAKRMAEQGYCSRVGSSTKGKPVHMGRCF